MTQLAHAHIDDTVCSELPDLRAALRGRLPGIGLATDLALAPIDHLFDHAASTLRFPDGPALYYANHQTSYESFLFSYIHAAVTGTKLFVVTHPGCSTMITASIARCWASICCGWAIRRLT